MTDRNTAPNHYALLQVKPTASPQEIRRAYRDLSKLYHPDTTTLPPEVATEKFKILNQAYATLSNPEQRVAYDYSIGISRLAVIQAPSYLNRPASERGKYGKSNAYLDPTDRPLSPGELFALFILGLTFVGCLILVVAVSWTKGEIVWHPASTDVVPIEVEASPHTSSPRDLTPRSSAPPADSKPLSPTPSPHPPTTTPAPTPPRNQPPSPLPLDNLSPKII
jgi:hypothetical protein